MAKKPANKPDADEQARSPEPSARAGGVHGVYLLAGPEALKRSEETAKLRKKLEKEHGEVDLVTFDGASAPLADVLDECRSFGLMATHKLVIVDASEELLSEATRPAIERYAENPPEGTTLVLRSKMVRANGKFEKGLMASGAFVACEECTESGAIDWVEKHAKKTLGVTIDELAAKALVSRVGVSLMKLQSELGKLGAAAGEGKHITPALVAEFVGVSREEEAWGIQRSLLQGNTASALAHLRHLLGVSRQPAQVVMYAVTDLARKLHALSAGSRSGEDMFAVAKAVGVWGDSSRALTETARSLHPLRTLAFLRACLKADERCKTGLSETERSLEMLIIRLHRMLGRAQ
jgi:DNA polymerase-3 subunit delta